MKSRPLIECNVTYNNGFTPLRGIAVEMARREYPCPVPRSKRHRLSGAQGNSHQTARKVTFVTGPILMIEDMWCHH